MLYIRTGKPGHGKTLNTIREVDQQAVKQGRVVYYHNINGLKPEVLKASWFPFDDPEKWFELPNDAIIVVDEAQGWFGANDPRSRPGEHITRFETMRHQGHEVHLVTQDPRYLHVHLRRLCNGHVHYWRVFKSQQLIRFESESVIEKVEQQSSFKDADKRRLKIDPSYFGAYTSTNAQHHFKTKIPKKMVLALIALVVIAVIVYRAYDRYAQGMQAGQTSTASTATAPQSAPTGSVVEQVTGAVGSLISTPTGDHKGPLTAEQYLAQRTPRIPDIPSSAPIYDELTKPKSYPRLSCWLSRDESYIERNQHRYRTVKLGQTRYMCECFTQQGTWHETRFSFCKNVVEKGYFDPAKPDPLFSKKPPLQAQVTPPPPSAPPAASSTAEAAKRDYVTIVPHDQGEFLW